MAVDTPARIAILGAGPIGLEAALYARYLGYEVEVFEPSPEIAPRVASAGDAQMLTPFARNSSSLGLRALAAQHEHFDPPSADAMLTYGQWFEQYLKPLSQCDLIADTLHLGTGVQKIGKVEITKLDCPEGEFDRGAWDFRLLVSGPRIVTADVVFDCSGVEPRSTIGHGGIPAPDEHSAAFSDDRIVGDLAFNRQFRERHEGDDSGKAIVVVGDDEGAARTILLLDQLKQRTPTTEIIWITRRPRHECPHGPLPGNDAIEARHTLFCQANELAVSGRVRWLPGTWIESVTDARPDIILETGGEQESRLVCQRIVRQPGYALYGDWSSELQLDLCSITEAPRPFSEHLRQRPSPYAVEYPAQSPTALITSEPNFYILGSRSFGRLPGFLYEHGLRQIRDVFTIIGDRATLDLYQ